MGLSKEYLTAYRPPSGSLDKFAADGTNSALVNVPMAPQFTAVNASKKSVKPEALSLAPAKVVTVTINPQGRACKIQELPGAFQVEGSATVKGKRELQIGKSSYFVAGTVVMNSGVMTGNPGDDLESMIETGDVVRLIGYGDQIAVLDVLARAGKMTISSNVPGAKVYVDGTLRGKTPCVVTATPGTREVSVRAEGYAERKLPVLVSSLAETAVSADLVEATGTLNVMTTPPGSSVTVNGEDKGKTPVKVALKPGSYEVRVEQAGYFPRTTQVTVVRDLEQPLTFSLVKQPTEEGQNPQEPSGGSGTGEYRYSDTGVVQARNGDSLFLGDRWTECVLSWDAVARDPFGTSISPARVRAGDTVTVYGDSPSNVKMIRVEQALPDKWPLEGYLVRTTSGYRVFGDDSTLAVGIPDDLQVIDGPNKSKEPVGNVPQGSRVRLYVDSSGQTVWAEYVWRAGASAEGTVGSLSGAIFRVLPSWDDLTLSTNTVVYRDARRTDFYDVRTGDSVVAAGPFAKDIRFIWIRSRPAGVKEVDAVALSTSSKEGKALYEYRGYALEGYPLYVGSAVTLTYPAEKKTVTANDLQFGDRVKLWVDENRKVAFGQVVLKNDFRQSGVFLGEKSGSYYFSGFSKYAPAADLIVTGLAPGEELEPGFKVLASGANGVVNYIEVQSETTVQTSVTGVVLGTKDLLRLRQDSGGIAPYSYGKDAAFVDWQLRVDGPVSALFPGDRVTASLGLGGSVVWVERTYTAPFKFEGTIESVSDRTIVVSDKTTRKTITVANPATIIKDDQGVGVTSLAIGDKVKVSGRDKANVDMVVVGW